jgi:hypothetical protein
MPRTKVAAVCLFLFSAAVSYGQEPDPFNYLKVSVDGEGFITLAEGEGPYERFFPLGTSFYPAIPMGYDTTNLQADYAAFGYMGGNLVVAPWDPERWPNRPGAIFQTESYCAAHLVAANAVGVKILADPALFWGNAGRWDDDGNIVWPQQRQDRFNLMVEWVENSYHAAAFMGYYNWDRPAWRYYDSRNRLPEPRHTPNYINSASSQLKNLESQENAVHKIFMAQGDPVKVRDLWKDYHSSADIVGGMVLPYPEPETLQLGNEQSVPTLGCLLPNYYSSVSGSLADAIHETARYAQPFGPRCKPYVAVLQGKDQGGEFLTREQMFFQAYDAVIHGAKGLVWYDDVDFQTPTEYDFFYRDGNIPAHLRDLINELSGYEINGAIKGDYDHTVLAVTTWPIPEPSDVVEESTFVCGKLVPKTHFLSDQIIMEGVAKKFYDWTYLIVACRPHEGAAEEYKVRFRPFFSAYDYYNYWGKHAEYSTVFKVGEGAMRIPQHGGSGYWEDLFNPGEVAIYTFQTPEPWQPENGE